MASPFQSGDFASRIALLRRSALLACLTESELANLGSRTQLQTYSAGQVIFLEGEPCLGLCIVEAGRIRLFTNVSGIEEGYDRGREQTIGLMGPGATFAEVPAFDGDRNPVSAEALVASRIVVVPEADIQALLASNPAFAAAALVAMAGRTRHLLAMVKDLSLRQVHGRVAKILLQVENPSSGVGAGINLQAQFTRQQIAHMAGTVREVVARSLRDFEHDGAIAIERDSITIIDRAKLARYQ